MMKNNKGFLIKNRTTGFRYKSNYKSVLVGGY